METQNQTAKRGWLKPVLLFFGIIFLLAFLLAFGWIAGIVWLVFFRKKINKDPKKQKLITIIVSVLSVFSFIFMVYSFATNKPLKSITISSDIANQELEVDQDYIIKIKCEPEDANISNFKYNIDGSCASLSKSNTDKMTAILHTTTEGTATISISSGEINSNSLKFTIIDKNVTETSDGINSQTSPNEIDEDKEKTEIDSETSAETKKKEFPKTISGDIDILFSESVNEDVTGKWRLTRVSTGTQIQDYALEYCNSFFQSDDEIHAIVNFTLNTTNKLTKITSDTLDIVVFDYVKEEELSAKTLFSGTILANYQINISTGEITQIPLESETTDTGSATEEPVADESTNTSETSMPSTDMVWIDDTGKKYHIRSSCSNMSDPYQIPKSEAEAMGRDACKKCY